MLRYRFRIFEKQPARIVVEEIVHVVRSLVAVALGCDRIAVLHDAFAARSGSRGGARGETAASRASDGCADRGRDHGFGQYPSRGRQAWRHRAAGFADT